MNIGGRGLVHAGYKILECRGETNDIRDECVVIQWRLGWIGGFNCWEKGLIIRR